MMFPFLRNSRRGVATVEFAVVAPIVFLFIFVAVEFGRLFMVLHGMGEAAREGCRLAIVANATVAEVEQTVANRLATFGVTEYQVTVEATTVGIECQGDPITVSVTVNYDDVSWLPTAKFLAGKTLTDSCTLPRESDNCTLE